MANRNDAIGVVEDVSDVEDDETECSAGAVGAEELFPDNNGTVIAPPRLGDDAPYIQVHQDGSISFDFAEMDAGTRVRTELIMGMYTRNATPLATLLGPIALVSDLMKKPKHEVALVHTQEEIASWDWKLATPAVGNVNYEENRVLKAFHKSMDDNRAEAAAALGVDIPGLKSWRHTLRCWKKGRQLYSDFQHIMEGESLDAIEAKMHEEFRHLGVDEIMVRVEVLKEQYRRTRSTQASAQGLQAQSLAAELPAGNGGPTATTEGW